MMDLSSASLDSMTALSAYTPHIHRDIYPAIDPTASQNSQAGRVVIITGASTGIGRFGLAKSFALANAKGLVLVARRREELRAAKEEMKRVNSNVEILTVVADVSKPDDVEEVYSQTKKRFGTADILNNNAAIRVCEENIADADVEKWWKDFEVNLRGNMLMTRGFLRLLGENGKGHIINMNSAASIVVGFAGMSSYGTSKLAALRLSELTAAENEGRVVSISVHPGMVVTEATPEYLKRFSLDTFELIGGTTVWLATDAASFLNGRFVSANWDVEDLMKRKEDILAGNDLKTVYQGRFGLDQFQNEV